jgi:hypothetical protein
VGIAIVLQALLVFVARRPGHAVQDLTAAEWRDVVTAASRALLAAVVMTAAFTLLPFVTLTSSGPSVPPAALLLLVPQAVPMALPVALVAAALVTRRAAMSEAHVRTALVCLAAAGAVASLVLLAEAIPGANQMFRESVFGRPVSRGLAELTLAELWRVGQGGVVPHDLKLPIDRVAAASAFHLRLALGVAPLLMTVVVLSLTTRLERRWASSAAVAVVTVGYYGTMTWIALAAPLAVAPGLVAWAPGGALIALATLWRYGAARSVVTDI